MKIYTVSILLLLGVASGQYERADFLSYAGKMCVGASAAEHRMIMETKELCQDACKGYRHFSYSMTPHPDKNECVCCHDATLMKDEGDYNTYTN